MGASATPRREQVDGVAPVIALPLEQRSCFTCLNARFPDSDIAGPVTYCTIYSEVVDSEAYAAEDCFTYERCAEGEQPDDMETLP